jgi:hypothetical protein
MIVERGAFAFVDRGSARGRISTAFTLKKSKNEVRTSAMIVRTDWSVQSFLQ